MSDYDGSVVRGRREFDPTDAVVWTAAVLLALLSGLGAGFVFWSLFTGLGPPSPWRLCVYLGGLVLGVLLPARQGVRLRVLLTISAAALILSFTFGSALFAPLGG